MTKEEFKKSQEVMSKYVLFIADVKNSSSILKTRNGRREFQTLLDETRAILNKYHSVVTFEDSGIKFKLIRKGDCIGFVVDLSKIINVLKEASENISQEWENILKRSNLRFHKNTCTIPFYDLNKYMDYLVYLEKDSKNLDEVDHSDSEDYNKNKKIKLLVELDVESFIEEDFIKSEISYMLNNYEWKVTDIKTEVEAAEEKEKAHEARETLFKFSTIQEKFDLIEGRKLNKVLGEYIDSSKVYK